MTFRPSDDVLDEISMGQSSSFSENQNTVLNQDDGEHIFNKQENQEDSQNLGGENTNSFVINVPTEEIKAPDLSELLKNSEENDIKSDINNSGNAESLENNTQEIKGVENFSNTIQSNENAEHVENMYPQFINTQTQIENVPTQELNGNTPQLDGDNKILDNNSMSNSNAENENLNYIDQNKLSDEERVKIVSSIEGSINSNLDYLVDRKLSNIVKKYKIINHLFFRWGIFAFAVIVGIVGGILFQVKANNTNNIQMVNDSLIERKSKWIEETSDKKMSKLVEDGVDVNVIVPYGSISINGENFQSKSNLIKYRGITLPQLASINYNSQNLISLEDFTAQKTTRKDIENLIEQLITNDSIYRETTNLSNVEDLRWIGNVFQGGLIEGFSLGCLNSDKVSDFVCDKFLDIFYTYGKYFNLSKYSGELFELIKNVKRQGKDVEPICNMVNEYTLRAGEISDTLLSVMEYCGDDYDSYKKMVNFIDLENSLKQPEISDRVFEDPDLNIYKLLSAQQSVHKILDGTSLNEIYIKSYLKFVQALISKDNGNNRYIPAIYKDLTYVFNTDELYQKLMQKGKLSSDLKIQLDQINNGNSIYGYSSLISQLTTTDIIKESSSYTGKTIREKSIEDIFSQYYTMNDRLKIRGVTKISDDEIKVQTEIFSDKIKSVTNDKTLKVTVVLHKYDNVLYVDSIKVASQTKLSDILSIYASEGDITFYAMLNYIDEQIGMRYELEPKKLEEESGICENLQGIPDIAIYTCDNLSISLYKGDIEYEFTLKNGVLSSFTIDDEVLDVAVRERLNGVMFTKYNTPTIIMSIIDFAIEEVKDDDIEKKLDIVDQFRIHFKLIPDDIQSIEGKSDEFLVKFTIGEFKLQSHYNVVTHLLTKISYMNCEKPLEIRQLSIAVTAENESQLTEILNNPKIFFAKVNPTIYKKYQKACLGNK